MEKLFKKLTVWITVLLAFSILLTVITLPTADKVKVKIDPFGANAISDNIKNLEMSMTSVIYVKNEKDKWEEYYRIHGTENRLWVSIDKMPKDLINAFIAIEDETFYDHAGINWKRTVGAVGNLIFKFDETEFGGSTITQQLIKNVTMDNARNATRKLREIVRALMIEKKLNKTQILEAYLNTIALGNGICGVQVAANYYFNKDVSELSLTECVTLAAITKNPSRFNPVTGEKANKQRRQIVLDKMLEWEYITPKQYVEVYDKNIKIDPTQKENYEPEINNYFVDTLIEQVIEDLKEKYDCSEDMASTMLYNGGFKIYSTVNPKIQGIMEEVYLDVDKYFKYKGEGINGDRVHVQSAMTIMDYSGHIVGIVGGAGEKTVNRGLNRAYNIPQQPGSTMKPLGVYALAIEEDLVHYTSKVVDKPIPHYYPDGKSGPKEWYGYYKGTISLDYAVRKSANTIPVKLLQELGVDKSFDFLTKKLNFRHMVEEDKNLSSLALGGCHYGITPTESAAAYAIFGNGGKYYKPKTYYKIERVTGELILEDDKKGSQVIGEDTATIMNHLLQGAVYGSEGTANSIRGFNYKLKAFAKTGTTSEANDLWMVAGSPYYIGSVWYGFDKQQTINSSSAAATVWRAVMTKVHKGLEKKEFVDSEKVYKKGIGYYKEGTKPDNITYKEESSEVSSLVSSEVASSKPESAASSAVQTSSKDTTTSTPVTSSDIQTPSQSEPQTPSETSSVQTPSQPTVAPPQQGGESSETQQTGE